MYALGLTLLEALTGRSPFEALEPTEALVRLVKTGLSIEMLLTDVNLPGMSGPELADRVRVQCPGVRVAFVSGDLGPPAGACGVFVQKPVDLDALVALVRRELTRG